MGRLCEALSGVECVGRGPEPLTWETLPGGILEKILTMATSSHSFAHGRVCKRWLAVGRKVQESFHPGPETRGSDVVKGIAQFPSLTAVHLEEGVLTDFVLGAVGVHCPGLRHLTLSQGEDWDEPLYTEDGLEEILHTLRGLRKLEFMHNGVELPDTVSCLDKLESLIVENYGSSFPGTLGALPSLVEMRLLTCDDEVEPNRSPDGDLPPHHADAPCGSMGTSHSLPPGDWTPHRASVLLLTSTSLTSPS